MFTKSGLKKIVLLMLLFLLLTGCVGSFADHEVQPVDGTAVLQSLQYLDRAIEGPLYAVSMTVPDAWVGEFEVENLGNALNFNYVGESGKNAYIFSVEALSEQQYWKASGSYPAYQTNIVNRGDTYFVYHLPIDVHYSGLSEAEFAQLTAAVPEIVASFTAVQAEQ